MLRAVIICGPLTMPRGVRAKMSSWMVFVSPSKSRLTPSKNMPHSTFFSASPVRVLRGVLGLAGYRVKTATPAVTKATTPYL